MGATAAPRVSVPCCAARLVMRPATRLASVDLPLPGLPVGEQVAVLRQLQGCLHGSSLLRWAR
jgi:hypothetical protein